MQIKTGEIREYEKIPKEELGKWSEPFSLEEIVDFKGVKMKIIRIKKLRKQLTLEFVGEKPEEKPEEEDYKLTPDRVKDMIVEEAKHG